MPTIFPSFADACEYVKRALGEYAHEFDVQAITDDVTAWNGGRIELTKEGDEFWACVQSHEL